MKYKFYNGVGVITTREPTPLQNSLYLEMPCEGKLRFNDTYYETSLCSVRIPRSLVRPINTLSFNCVLGTIMCEGILLKETCMCPEMGVEANPFVKLAQKVDDLSEKVKKLELTVSKHESQINQSELF